MRNIGASIFIFSIFGFYNIVGAQCDFKLDAEIIRHSTCISNGVIKVTLSGEEIDTDNVHITLTKSGNLFESNVNGFQFTGLSVGTYTVTAIAKCKNSMNDNTKFETVTIISEYGFLNGIVSGKRISLNCTNTGVISFNIWDGTLPYTVAITSSSNEDAVGTKITSETEGDITIEGLAPGEYVFTVSDQCSNELEFPVEIEELENDFPPNPYDDYLSFINCNKAEVHGVSIQTNPYNIYWETMRDEYYEVAFSVDGVDESTQWVGFSEPQSIDLPETYSKLYADGKTVKIYIRLKGTGMKCYKSVGDIQFKSSQAKLNREPIYSCGDYGLKFNLYEEYAVCPPFKWKIIDDDSPGDTVFVSGEVLNQNFGEQIAGNLIYGKNFILKITADGIDVEDPFFYSSPSTDIEILSEDKSCEGYKLSFKLENESFMCAPFQWIIIDGDLPNDTIFKSVEGIEPFGNQTTEILDYEKNHIIIVIDKNGKPVQTEKIYRAIPKATLILNNLQKSCDNYDVSLSLENSVFMCPDFNWEIFDGAGNSVYDSLNFDPTKTQNIENLEYDTTYRLVMTDGKGRYVDTVFSIPVPKTTVVMTPAQSCADYKLSLSLADENVMCDPVWTVTDKSNVVIASGTGNSIDVNSLLYNKNYSVTVEDSNGKKIDTVYKIDKTKTPEITPGTMLPVLPGNYCFDLPYTVSDVCLPYKWEVWEKRSTDSIHIKDSIDNNNNTGVIECLEYGKEYYIKVIDDSGDTVFIIHGPVEPPLRTIEIRPGGGMADSGDLMWGCDTYRATTIVANINLPYCWFVYKKDCTADFKNCTADLTNCTLSCLDNCTLFNSGSSNDTITDLKYDSVYIVVITDGITILTDTIDMGAVVFPLPHFSDTADYDYQCEDYKFRFSVKDIYCPDYYTWEVRNEQGDYITGGTGSIDEDANGETHHVTLHYDTIYHIKVTDIKGNDTIIKWSKPSIKPYFDNMENTNPQCYDYGFQFTVKDMYCDYTLEVFKIEKDDEDKDKPVCSKIIDDNGDLVCFNEKMGKPASHTAEHSIRLKYDTVYEIKITYGKDSVITTRYSKPSIQPIFIGKEPVVHLCYYDVNFSAENIYCKYKWEVVNMDKGGTNGTVVEEKSDITSVPTDGYTVRLNFDTTYIIRITDDKDSVISKQYKVDSPKSSFSDYGYDNYTCDNYEFFFNVNLGCFPYKWEIRNGDDEFVAGKSDEISADIRQRLNYDIEYTLTVTDAFGHVITLTPPQFTVSRNNNPAPEFECRKEDHECHEYEYILNVTKISCFPYKWVIVENGSNDTIEYKENLNNLMEYPSVTLEYGKEYTVTVTDNLEKSTIKEIKTPASYVYKPKIFEIKSGMSNCISEQFKGYIEISGDYMRPGTQIHFVDGPQVPPNDTVTLQETDPKYFYPFSQDYTEKDSVVIEHGEYTFEIIDICGDTLTMVHKYTKTVAAEGFGYELDEETDFCLGITRVLPRGKAIINGDPADKTWFFMKESPTNIIKYIDGDDPNDYFAISKTGRYVIEMRVDENECGIDTIIIDHVQKSIDLDGSSSYVCGKDDEENEQGNIRVHAINGKEPYTYTLYESDSVTRVQGIESNETGIFQYGFLGENYVVKVRDACNKLFNIGVQISALNRMTLLNGTENICKDGEIQINCLLLGATSYQWISPAGIPLGDDNERNITIHNATTDDSGMYRVKIMPSGCSEEIMDSIMITVHDIPEPTAESPVNLCIDEEDYTLSAESLGPDYSLQWYSEDDKLLAGAPTISRSEVKDTVFYVKQTFNTFSCESEKKKIEVKVNPLPEKNAVASGWSCKDGQPEITVTDIVAGYVYTVYDKEGAKVAEFSGEENETMTLTLPVTVSDNTNFYLKTASSVGCSLSPDGAEFEVVVTKITISPEELSVYKHDKPYGVQLETNAVQPEFKIADGSLLEGLSLSLDGFIGGTVPRSVGYEESVFTVAVTDENKCEATHEYLLRSCGPAPEIPFAELHYCKGERSVLLEAVPADGYTLKWYDAEMMELSEVPTPDTEIVGDHTFYVTQISEELQCESDSAEIKVTVTALPKPDFDAPDINVCLGSSPVVGLSNLHETYTYNIYADAAMTEKLATVTEETSVDVTLPTVPDSDTSYYIYIVDSLSCESKEYAEVGTTVINLKILTESLPVYKHDKPYGVQIETNAVKPELSEFEIIEGSLLEGLSLSPDGFIGGTVPRSVGYEESVFTVAVTDENKCEATHEYLLRSCGPAPEIPFAELHYCEGERSVLLQAVPADGYTLKWYDAEMMELSEVPTPDTEIVGDHTFYVTQISEELQCESDSAEIKVTVTALPKPDFKVEAKDACYEGSPTILLYEIRENYSYAVYTDKTFRNNVGSLTGTASGTIIPNDIITDSTTYYILITDSLGCVSTEWAEVTAGVIKLYIEPETLPPYIKNTDYEQLLISNAQSPIFTVADGHLPDGLTLNTSGLIYGNVPNGYRDINNIVAIEVHDLNGCRVAKEYTFNGNLFVPKVFTPNGDGINDVFMRGYKVVIFDRLGIIMFQGNNGWDGTYNGRPVADDIYFYKLEYPDANNIRKIKTGYIGVHRGH